MTNFSLLKFKVHPRVLVILQVHPELLKMYTDKYLITSQFYETYMQELVLLSQD